MPRMSQLLKEQLPSLHENYELKFIIANAAQEKFIRENLYHKLSEYLKQNLKNYKINLLIEVGESEKKEEVIYLSTDKYNYLVNLNPALNRLKKNFNLELE
jgi:DNA polymerase III subunit gamma/tau